MCSVHHKAMSHHISVAECINPRSWKGFDLIRKIVACSGNPGTLLQGFLVHCCWGVEVGIWTMPHPTAVTCPVDCDLSGKTPDLSDAETAFVACSGSADSRQIGIFGQVMKRHPSSPPCPAPPRRRSSRGRNQLVSHYRSKPESPRSPLERVRCTLLYPSRWRFPDRPVRARCRWLLLP